MHILRARGVNFGQRVFYTVNNFLRTQQRYLLQMHYLN